MNAAGESPDSIQVSAAPDAGVTTPAVPVGLSASAGNAQVSLTWSASTNATRYNVKRATASGGPYAALAASTSASYTDSAVTNGTTYYYVVSALDAAGESADSAQASARPTAPTPKAAVPGGLSAISGNKLVTLSWSASANAASYHVKRSTVSG